MEFTWHIAPSSVIPLFILLGSALLDKGLVKIIFKKQELENVITNININDRCWRDEQMSGKSPKKIDHIGIAVLSIEEVLPFYVGSLKLPLLGMEEVESQGVKVAFLGIGESKIELLEPLSEDSPIAKFIQKRGEGIHHVALGVTNIESRIEDIRENGVQMIHNEPVNGAGGAKVAFLHPKSARGVLYEFCEKNVDDQQK